MSRDQVLWFWVQQLTDITVYTCVMKEFLRPIIHLDKKKKKKKGHSLQERFFFFNREAYLVTRPNRGKKRVNNASQMYITYIIITLTMLLCISYGV